jgi:predicted GH43/DUF377 family glycosyl hydrolase
VHSAAGGPIYRVGLALLDIDDPHIVLMRSNEWIFAPTTTYERNGDVDKVVFPNGWVLDEASGIVSIYYGAADVSVALATASLTDMLDHLHNSPPLLNRRAGDSQ